MPVVVFFASILIVPGFVGLATTPRWCVLACTVPFFWYFVRGPITTGHVLGLTFLAWCALSLTWAFSYYDGVLQLGKFGLLGLLFCIGAARKDLHSIWAAAALGAGVNGVLMIAQEFGWSGLPQAVLPAGTFFNKNLAAEFCVLALVGALGLPGRWKWLAVAAVPGVVLGQSKTVALALAVAAIILMWQRFRAGAIALLVIFPVIAGVIASSSSTWAQRLQVWQDTLAGMTFWGRGIGAFWSTFPEHARQIDALALRPGDAHSDILQVTYEVGPGSLVLVALLAFALRGPWRTESYVLVVFFIIGLAGFPLYMPATAMLAALAVGHLCRDRSQLHAASDRSGARDLHGEALANRGRLVVLP